MKSFLQRFGALVLGVLIGFDRWRFRGSKRMLCYPEGVMSFLSYQGVLLKDFNKPYARDLTAAVCAAIEKPAEEAGIKMPSFFGYLKYSVGILFPLFILITLIFFHPL